MKNIIQWLILVIISTMLFSCSNLSSVRNGDKLRKVNKDPVTTNYEKKNKELVSDYAEIVKPENKIKKNIEIPPLNEQLTKLEEGQKELKRDYVELKDEVNILKMRLKGLESQFTEKEFDNSNDKAVTGYDENETENSAYVLLPDEESSDKEKNDSEKKTVKKPIKSSIDQDNSSNLKKNNQLESSNDNYFKKYYQQIENKDYNSSIIELIKKERQLEDKELLAECRYLIGKIFLKLNRYEKAHQYFAKIIDSNLNHEKKAEAYTGIAKSLLKKGMVAQAKDTYSRIVKNFPRTIYVVEAKKMLQKL